MNTYLEKLRSIGTIGRAGSSRRTQERVPGGVVIQTEHADGRVDAIVRPDTVDYKAVTHKTGKKKGQVAAIERKGRKA